MRLPTATYPLVLVEWEDSAQPRPAWEWLDDYTIEAGVNCISVGYLVAHSPRAIAVAPNLGDLSCVKAQASGIFRIPRSSIRRISEIKACRNFDCPA